MQVLGLVMKVRSREGIVGEKGRINSPQRFQQSMNIISVLKWQGYIN